MIQNGAARRRTKTSFPVAFSGAPALTDVTTVTRASRKRRFGHGRGLQKPTSSSESSSRAPKVDRAMIRTKKQSLRKGLHAHPPRSFLGPPRVNVSPGIAFSGPIPFPNTSLNRRRGPVWIQPGPAKLRQGISRGVISPNQLHPSLSFLANPSRVTKGAAKWTPSRGRNPMAIIMSNTVSKRRTPAGPSTATNVPLAASTLAASSREAQQIRIVTELSHIPEPLLAQRSRNGKRVLPLPLTTHLSPNRTGPSTLSDRFS